MLSSAETRKPPFAGKRRLPRSPCLQCDYALQPTTHTGGRTDSADVSASRVPCCHLARDPHHGPCRALFDRLAHGRPNRAVLSSALRLLVRLVIVFGAIRPGALPAAEPRYTSLEAALAPGLATALAATGVRADLETTDSSHGAIFERAGSGGFSREPVALLHWTEGFLKLDSADDDALVFHAVALEQLCQPRRALAVLARRKPTAPYNHAIAALVAAKCRLTLGQIGAAQDLIATAKPGGENLRNAFADDLAATREKLSALDRPQWEKTLKPFFRGEAIDASKATPELARYALEAGALDAAHQLAVVLVEKNPRDDRVRELFLDVVQRAVVGVGEADSAFCAVGVLPAIAHARARPSDASRWHEALDLARRAAIPGQPSAETFATLIHEAKAAGASVVREAALMPLYQAKSPLELTRAAAALDARCREDRELGRRVEALELAHGAWLPALAAARAKPADGALWRAALDAVRPRPWMGDEKASAYDSVITLADDAEHPQPIARLKFDLSQREEGYGLIAKIRDALPHTAQEPDLPGYIDEVVARHWNRPRTTLGFNSALDTAAKPFLAEADLATGELRAAINPLATPEAQAAAWLAHGVPGEAEKILAPRLRDPALDAAARGRAWRLQAQVLAVSGRFPEAVLAADRAAFLTGADLTTWRERLIAQTAAAADPDGIAGLAEQLAKQPTEPKLWARLAEEWCKENTFAPHNALRAAAAALVLDPKNENARIAQARALAAFVFVEPGKSDGLVPPQIANGSHYLGEKFFPAALRDAALRQIAKSPETEPAYWTYQIANFRETDPLRRAATTKAWLARLAPLVAKHPTLTPAQATIARLEAENRGHAEQAERTRAAALAAQAAAARTQARSAAPAEIPGVIGGLDFRVSEPKSPPRTQAQQGPSTAAPQGRWRWCVRCSGTGYRFATQEYYENGRLRRDTVKKNCDTCYGKGTLPY